jgi:hypothetical protein
LKFQQPSRLVHLPLWFMVIASVDSQGFIAVASMKRAGKLSDIETRAMSLR